MSKDLHQQRIELMDLCTPVIEWMNKNYHPHTKVIIESNGFELVEGLLAMEMLEDANDTNNI
jgi:hypothetical protein